jgi:SAM-dependent methyltransferase
MAINIIEYHVMRFLRQQNVLPLGGDLLQLGEANWYGDIDLNVLRADIKKFAAPDKQQHLLGRLEECLQANRPQKLFEIAEVYWHTFLAPASMTAIDFHGTQSALRLDLNSPIDLRRQFNFIANSGTLEHVFNIAQALKTAHDHLKTGGLVLHQFPFAGLVDHGFFNFNPTFIWDLSAANHYQVCLLIHADVNSGKITQLHTRERILEMAKNNQIGQNALLYAVLRRPDLARPFRIPIQGYYAGSISEEAAKAWHGLTAGAPCGSSQG